MKSTHDFANNALSSAIEKWGNKKWFQAAVILWLFLMPLLSIVDPIVSAYVSKSQAQEVVSSTVEERDIRKEANHKDNFEQSRHLYALAKKELENSLSSINCDYIFLVEYHNGAENIMTGVQFCKFDITLEVGQEVSKKVSFDKFRDENIAKYDILLSDELRDNKLVIYTKEHFEEADRYLALQLEYLEAQSFALINLQNREGKVFGTLMFVAKEDSMNTNEIYTLTRKIEQMFNLDLKK